MPRRKERRNALRNSVEPFASRWSDYQGCWLLGQLPPEDWSGAPTTSCNRSRAAATWEPSHVVVPGRSSSAKSWVSTSPGLGCRRPPSSSKPAKTEPAAGRGIIEPSESGIPWRPPHERTSAGSSGTSVRSASPPTIRPRSGGGRRSTGGESRENPPARTSGYSTQGAVPSESDSAGRVHLAESLGSPSLTPGPGEAPPLDGRPPRGRARGHHLRL